MAHRIYLVPIPAEVVPKRGGPTAGVDVAQDLSDVLTVGSVVGVSTVAQLDGSMLMTLLIEH